ncbi:tryptophan-rich sensory protein [bacterium]|nr:tryptophan-rich sensory protein [bacterium]
MYNSDWYNLLIQPPLSPPNWLFPPVWAVLYITIIAAIIIYSIKKTQKNKLSGYIYFTLQTILNFVWSPAFFTMQNIRLALIIILLLDIFVILTIKKFYKISKISGLILIPYLAWILFATYLNAGYYILNR